MEIFEVRFEVYLNNKLIQKQILEAPKEVIILNFFNLAKQISQTREKYKIRVVKPELIYIPWTNERKLLDNSIEIQNY